MPEEMNDLALKAKTNPDALLHLWQGISRFAYKIAMRYQQIAALNGAVDADDLEQCAFLGFYEAVQSFDPLQGSFLTLLSYGVRSACRRALGLDGRERKEHYNTTSLDAPIPGTDDLTLADTIPDVTAGDSFLQAEMHSDIEKALHHLPDDMAAVISLHDLQGLSIYQTAKALQKPPQIVRNLRKNAFRKIRARRSLAQYRPVTFRHKSLASFRSDWTSVVEAEVIRRLDG